MALSFDPAVAAHAAFTAMQSRGELGDDTDQAARLEAVFSSGAGEEATEAYRALVALGERHPHARAFQAFLIYSTWQQGAEDPIAEHFERGIVLCDRFLAEVGAAEPRSHAQIQALRLSFLHALGRKEREEQDEVGEAFDQDAFKGGD